jgi:hypothetical protein
MSFILSRLLLECVGEARCALKANAEKTATLTPKKKHLAARRIDRFNRCIHAEISSRVGAGQVGRSAAIRWLQEETGKSPAFIAFIISVASG